MVVSGYNILAPLTLPRQRRAQDLELFRAAGEGSDGAALAPEELRSLLYPETQQANLVVVEKLDNSGLFCIHVFVLMKYRSSKTWFEMRRCCAWWQIMH